MFGWTRRITAPQILVVGRGQQRCIRIGAVSYQCLVRASQSLEQVGQSGAYKVPGREGIILRSRQQFVDTSRSLASFRTPSSTCETPDLDARDQTTACIRARK